MGKRGGGIEVEEVGGGGGGVGDREVMWGIGEGDSYRPRVEVISCVSSFDLIL